MTTAVIAQARTGSTRLPGKVLRPLAGESVISHVVRRANAIKGADIVCLATSHEASDDLVEAEGDRLGIPVHRGSENDVLDRFLGAARRFDADIVVRITCDCPLIDPQLCDAVITLREEHRADYASNVDPPSWPHGLDCEVFTRASLERAGRETDHPYDREHVTPWLREADDVRRVSLRGPGGVFLEQRWVLDHPEDFDFLDQLFRELPAPPAIPHWREIMDVVERRPALAAINAHRVDANRRPTEREAEYAKNPNL